LPACAALYPPENRQPWFVRVADTVLSRAGSVDSLSLTGPDGAAYSRSDLPVPLRDGTGTLRLVIDRRDLIGAGDVTASYAISHTRVADLDVIVGVVDDRDTLLCEQTFVSRVEDEQHADPLVGEVTVAGCGGQYPPAGDRLWFLRASDRRAGEAGTIDAFGLRGPDGDIRDLPGLPVAIPDADPDGLIVFFGD
jgi:hypothetical protein